MKEIEIPFGANDSELKGLEYTIPDSMEAIIKDGKVIVRKKESEDERIRTRLVALVEAFGQGKYKDEMLAYLERQKDERELVFIEGKVEGIRQTCQEIKDAMSLYEPKDLTPFESTFREYMDSAIRYCLSGEGYQQFIKEWAADLLNLEKQKDQKPAEWNDADDKIQRNLMSLLSCMRGDRIAEATFKKYYPWLRDLPKRFNLQQPAEWSEEDKKYLNLAINIVASDFGENSPTVSWLKSLRPQPNWKPSEEQMEALKRVYYNRPIGSAELNSLESLYKDLQKLL